MLNMHTEKHAGLYVNLLLIRYELKTVLTKLTGNFQLNFKRIYSAVCYL